VGHDTIVNLLLEHEKLSVNLQVKAGATALMWAAACGNESIAYFLIQVSLLSRRHTQFFSSSNSFLSDDVFFFLPHRSALQAGANVNLVDSQGISPLTHAVIRNEQVCSSLFSTIMYIKGGQERLSHYFDT
jgi:ankyrin repeat protein